MTVTLPPELESRVAERARDSGSDRRGAAEGFATTRVARSRLKQSAPRGPL